MKPSVGRVVHYVSYGTPGGEYKSECRAAIVTAVGRDPEQVVAGLSPGETARCAQELDLCVLNPTGLFFNQGVKQDEPGKRGGTWHWPERVEA
jgi:hypothetical protein